MSVVRSTGRRCASLVLALALAFAAGVPAAAQSRAGGFRLHPDAARSETLARGHYVVVVDLDAYELHFMRGFTVLWSAKVGVGTGLRLKGPDGEWHFETPRGVYQVEYREINPDWYKPDWFYVENGERIPPPDDPSRRLPGGLGAAAVYIGNELAIHGTDRPELLGQNVSRGCIRLANEDALRLFHNVQVGTEVIVVGRGRPDVRRPAASQLRGSASRSSVLIEDMVPPEWRRMSTTRLLALLEESLDEARARDVRPRWTQAASLLLKRGLDDDDRAALRGLFLLHDRAADPAVAEEFATFLADAYGRATVQTLAALAMLPPRQREGAAQLLVQASMRLFPGTVENPVAPWPTRRVPRDNLQPVPRRAWDVLHAAEREYRETKLALEM